MEEKEIRELFKSFITSRFTTAIHGSSNVLNQSANYEFIKEDIEKQFEEFNKLEINNLTFELYKLPDFSSCYYCYFKIAGEDEPLKIVSVTNNYRYEEFAKNRKLRKKRMKEIENLLIASESFRTCFYLPGIKKIVVTANTNILILLYGSLSCIISQEEYAEWIAIKNEVERIKFIKSQKNNFEKLKLIINKNQNDSN